MAATFACPPDCGWCCTHLDRDVPSDEADSNDEFRGILREVGIYHCDDAPTRGLSLSNDEAMRLRAESERRGLALDFHPRTYLLETRRRLIVALDWHLPYASCPFYADFKCTAYELRPLVCRAFPVLAPSPRWSLAPACPKTSPTREARASGTITLGTFLRPESAARRAIEKAHVELDEATMALLAAPDARFATGLDAKSARDRAHRYRIVGLDEARALFERRA